MVELADKYVLTSNRESGFGRYDVMLEPKTVRGDGVKTGGREADAIIIEFKVQDSSEEKELSDTVASALAQIEEQNYEAGLIRKYGFAFCGKKVLIG